LAALKHFLVGNPLKTAQAAHERLSKKTALAIFSSDALSSTAYATEEILLVLAVAAALVRPVLFVSLYPSPLASAPARSLPPATAKPFTLILPVVAPTSLQGKSGRQRWIDGYGGAAGRLRLPFPFPAAGVAAIVRRSEHAFRKFS
jgi:hypothetical protein